jgi:hypothetical protein
MEGATLSGRQCAGAILSAAPKLQRAAAQQKQPQPAAVA